MPQSERSLSHVSACQLDRAMREIARVSGDIIPIRSVSP